VGAVERDARREALAFERVVRELVAILIEELLPLAALRETREPHTPQAAADRLVLVVRDERLCTLIHGTELVAGVGEPAANARSLQIWIERVVAQRFAVGLRLRSGIVDLLIRLPELFAHLLERVVRGRAARGWRRQQRACEQNAKVRCDSSVVHAQVRI